MNRFFSSSLVVSFLYALLGFFFLNVSSEYLLLASAVVVVSGLLPDIDGSDEIPSRELAGLLAAVSPLLFFELYPGLFAQRISRVALIVICCYLLTRIVIMKIMRLVFSPRGMIHSIPAAVVTGQAVFLMFYDLNLVDRSYVAIGAFLGFLFHLIIEAYSGVDFVATAVGESVPKGGEPVLKMFGRSWGATAVMYCSMFFLGVLIVREVFPNLGVSAELTY